MPFDFELVPIMIPQELYNEIASISAKEQKSVADVISEAIGERLKKAILKSTDTHPSQSLQ